MSPRVLVAYASKFGSTREIAEAVAATLEEAGLDVELHPAREVKHLDDYGAVVLGSAVYTAHWRGEAKRLLSRHRDELAQRDVWLFSSGPVGDEAGPEAADRWTRPKAVERLAEEVGAHEHVVFGGSVDEGHGGPIRKSMARNTPEEGRDLRDWDAIRDWARAIATTLSASRSTTGQRS